MSSPISRDSRVKVSVPLGDVSSNEPETTVTKIVVDKLDQKRAELAAYNRRSLLLKQNKVIVVFPNGEVELPSSRVQPYFLISPSEDKLIFSSPCTWPWGEKFFDFGAGVRIPYRVGPASVVDPANGRRAFNSVKGIDYEGFGFKKTSSDILSAPYHGDAVQSGEIKPRAFPPASYRG